MTAPIGCVAKLAHYGSHEKQDPVSPFFRRSDGVGHTSAKPSPDLPVVVTFAAPPYPRFAKDHRMMGKVITQITITQEGLVADSKIVSRHPAFTGYAIEALKQWKFKRQIDRTPCRLPYLSNSETTAKEQTSIRSPAKLSSPPNYLSLFTFEPIFNVLRRQYQKPDDEAAFVSHQVNKADRPALLASFTRRKNMCPLIGLKGHTSFSVPMAHQHCQRALTVQSDCQKGFPNRHNIRPRNPRRPVRRIAS